MWNVTRHDIIRPRIVQRIDFFFCRNIENFGYSLKGVLHKAQEDDRLVMGVYECAKILQE